VIEVKIAKGKSGLANPPEEEEKKAPKSAKSKANLDEPKVHANFSGLA
jgi:hypothetical protein